MADRLEEIREKRRRGALLGDLTRDYGADDVVKALGHMHIACSLGVGPGTGEDDTDEDESYGR